MKPFIRSRHFYYMLFMDAVLVVACFYLAYLIRFEFSIPGNELSAFANTWLFVLLVKICTFFFFNLYRGMWRYTSLVDMFNVAKGVFISSLLIILAVLMVHGFQGYPRSVFIIDGFLTFLAIGGIRMVIRLYFVRKEGIDIFSTIRKRRYGEKRLLIIGAGDAGEKVVREIRDNPSLKFEPVGFLDDDPDKQGRTIHGIRILGALRDMADLREAIDEILIAVPSGKGEAMRRIVEICKRTGKPYKTVPSMVEMINGKVSVRTIRDVTMADLLGREEVHLDHGEIKNYLYQKRILVTGAGGTIGGELVRQISQFNPQAMALLDVSELNLFQIEMESQHRFAFLPISAYLVNVRDREDVERVFREFHPQVVFHAAAYKHVPIQELHPWEAVYNNVLGTRNLLEITMENGVERFVFVSTDKAVRPVNVMGATKRIAEMIVECMAHRLESHGLTAQGTGQAQQAVGHSEIAKAFRLAGIGQGIRQHSEGLNGTRFMAVRFGNVIGSSGSVIPIFQRQIACGGPVTVTHPEVMRYFMTITEAAQLILQTGAMGRGGEIFILDMGTPIRILDLARDLIRFHDFEPERDIPIQFIGLRPGEKLYEELITEGEGIVATEHEKILAIRGNSCDSKKLDTQIDELLTIARTYDVNAIKRKLQEIVPEYTPQFFT